VLVAARRREADDFLAAMERVSSERADHPARLACEVGLEAARVVLWAEREPSEALALLRRIEPLLPQLGGSRAQRRFFSWVEPEASRAATDARRDTA
jgi:hypothetical protein